MSEIEKIDSISSKEKVEQSSQNNDFLEIQTKTDKKQTKLIDSYLFAIFSVFGVIFMSLVLVFQIWLTPIKVVGSSMQPTINISITSEADEEHCDVVYYTKQDSYSSDDIVIVENTNNKYVPTSDTQTIEYIIKRIVATPDQTIRFCRDDKSDDSMLYYYIRVLDENGNDTGFEDTTIKEEMCFSRTDIETIINNYKWATNENSLNYSQATANFYKQYYSMFYNIFEKAFDNLDNSILYEYTVPENEYFVMGDNRNISQDSRFFGSVDVDDIAGYVVLHIPYGQNIWQAIWKKITYAI